MTIQPLQQRAGYQGRLTWTDLRTVNQHLYEMSAVELARLMREGVLTSVEVTDYFLDRIARLDPCYGAFLEVTPEIARRQARDADAARRAGKDLGPLQGVPYAAKDLFDVAGLPTMAGCDLLRHNVKATSAAVIRAMTDSGMVLLGKTKLVQFAHGSIGMNLNQGTPLNPWAAAPLAPGGSSSGSAVAVAVGMAPLALGTDTGGSARGPASLCGAVGWKSTYGSISREGVYPLSPTLDSVGVLAMSAADILALLPVLTATGSVTGSTPENFPLKGLRIAYADSLLRDTAPDAIAAVMAAGERLAALGAELSHIAFDEADEASRINPDGLISKVEGYYQNCSLLETDSAWLDPMIVQSFASGPTALAVDYYAAIQQMGPLQQRTKLALAPFDALLAPSVPVAALPLAVASQTGTDYKAMNSRYAQCTRAVNVLGLCALSLPGAMTGDGRPIGVQLIGAPGADARILAIGEALMRTYHGGKVPRPPFPPPAPSLADTENFTTADAD